MNITMPVPQTALGTVDSQGRLIISREWYRFFSLLVTATGGSTELISAAVAAALAVMPDAENLRPDVEELRSLIHMRAPETVYDDSEMRGLIASLVTVDIGPLEQRLATLESYVAGLPA